MFRLEKKFLSRGTPHPTGKGKNFWHQIWLDTCSDWKKSFCRGETPPPPPVKGKIFDTRFGLIHVQTGKKIFCRWNPLSFPPPLTGKGKNFWHQIWLDTCSDWKKNFCRGTPPSPGIARSCYGYAAYGMPLAFTQEDFLVVNYFKVKTQRSVQESRNCTAETMDEFFCRKSISFQYSPSVVDISEKSTPYRLVQLVFSIILS